MAGLAAMPMSPSSRSVAGNTAIGDGVGEVAGERLDDADQGGGEHRSGGLGHVEAELGGLLARDREQRELVTQRRAGDLEERRG